MPLCGNILNKPCLCRVLERYGKSVHTVWRDGANSGYCPIARCWRWTRRSQSSLFHLVWKPFVSQAQHAAGVAWCWQIHKSCNAHSHMTHWVVTLFFHVMLSLIPACHKRSNHVMVNLMCCLHWKSKKFKTFGSFGYCYVYLLLLSLHVKHFGHILTTLWLI